MLGDLTKGQSGDGKHRTRTRGELTETLFEVDGDLLAQLEGERGRGGVGGEGGARGGRGQ